MRGSLRRIGRLAAAALTVLLILLVPTQAGAVTDLRLIELDGNALNSAAAGYDWNSLFPTGDSTGEITKVFIQDGTNSPADTGYFAGGGSKDIYDLTEWRHDPGDVAPDKDEIVNAWAVAYRSSRDTGKNNVGDLIFYFGADRFAASGDAQIGFWFFRNSIGRNTDGTFAGAHRVGDVLILSDFTQGGKISSVRLYTWVGSGGSDGALNFVASAGDCLDAAADAPMCAEVNGGNTSAPWTYVPKSGTAGTYPAGSFYEGGVNISRLVPAARCFGAYLAETRSSQSVSAQLKDLALGPFNTCPRAAAPAGPGGSSSALLGGPLPATGPEHVPGLSLVGSGTLALGVWMRAAGRRHRPRRPRRSDDDVPPLSMTGFLLYG